MIVRLLCLAFVATAYAQDLVQPSEFRFPPGWTYPGAEWETIKDPEAAGFSSARLDVLRVWLKTQDTTGMMAIHKYLAKDPRVLHATVKHSGSKTWGPSRKSKSGPRCRIP